MKPTHFFHKLRRAAILAVFVSLAPSVHAYEFKYDTDSYDPIMEWCGDSVTLLDEAEEQAKMVYSMGRMRDAKMILLGALQRASSNLPSSWQLKPHRVSHRGFERFVRAIQSAK